MGLLVPVDEYDECSTVCCCCCGILGGTPSFDVEGCCSPHMINVDFLVAKLKLGECPYDFNERGDDNMER